MIATAEGRRARLVINADDFGLSAGVNRGILAAHAAGTVTSTSLLPNLPAFDDAVHSARATPTLGIGLHFNLTTGAPVSAPDQVPSLVDSATGQFHALRVLAARSLGGGIDPADVWRECAAQVARLTTHGIRVTHLDSHRHVHVLPGIWGPVRQAARAAGIGTVRLPFDAAAWTPAHPRAFLEQIVLRAAYRWAGGNGYRPATDHFRGGVLYPQHRFKARLLRVLDRLEPGLTELMVHPGYADSDLATWDGYTWGREAELTALLDPEVRARLAAGDVELVTFGGGATCASPKVPRISMIVPAYNEGRYLPRLLASIDVARRRYSPDPDAVEVIVSDNLSTDDTAELARGYGSRVVTQPKRVIAAVRNLGARAATGDIFVFVDADSSIHPDTFTRVARALASPRVVGGATGVTMDRWSAGIAVTYALLEAWCWVSGWDTGVLFCRRETFDEIGGFPEHLMFAEDLAFYSGLRRLGRTRGQRFVRLRGVRTITSTRKFDQFGDWGWPLANAKVLWWEVIRSPRARALVERHWYRVRR